MDAVRLVLGKTGHWTVRVESEQHTRYLHSQHDPVREARRLVESWGECSGREVIIFGLGLGYHIKEFLNLNPYCERIDVLEPRRPLLDWARQVTPEIFNDSRIVFHCANRDGLLRWLHMRPEASIHVHPPTVESLPTSQLKSLLQEMLVLRSSEQRYRQQLADNLRENSRNIHCRHVLQGCQDQYAGTPGVLVAAGPSVVDAMGFVHTMCQTGGIVLSVSRVLTQLLNHGIRPFGCVLTESSDSALNHFKDIPRSTTVPTLYALPTASPLVLASYPGEVVYVFQKGHDDVERMAQTFGADLFLTGGSVSTLALDLLYYYGCDPIIFTGLDLAYIDGKSHADSREVRSGMASYMVESVSVTGGRIVSTVSWQSFRRWIEEYIRAHSDRTYVNVSAGTHIEGTKAMTYEEALNYCKANTITGHKFEPSRVQ
ncbi:MAG: DUF115 domain-containing protein [Alicyclobacillus macrosporangiidus]|uniref:motility associated factor glycosyltransferase family protein n=1 Tax=Alicyclobacillus macrosporangiidus TaxID=392015 RepID=UPI0026E946B4|nr:6-hydroxymethylpterin diphosphokinase MptE-like protein [Alicyclobacillus macrosporangiidus]MCL6598707.1 DUF115 domain-containing protein [Alicyclobacillus macrosporangiidus]